MNGYALQKGEYERRYLVDDELWEIANWLFSSYSKNDSSYKFIFLKSIIDCMEDECFISFDKLFERFTEISWSLVLKYNIRQKAITKGKSETYLEQILHNYKHNYKHNYLQGQFIAMDALSYNDRIMICRDVKLKCKKYVVGALYGDTNRLFYSFNKREEWININPIVSKFVKTNKKVIETLNYCKWSKFYAGINDDELKDKLEAIIDGNNIRRKESVYRTILAYEFEGNNPFEQKEKSRNTLEMLFVAEEQKNDKLSCMFCNIDKERIILENKDAFAVYDSFPVSKGHVLIIPKKHIKNYFEADKQTKTQLWKLVDECKEMTDKNFAPQGYNIGINCGEAAGQTVMHLHIHLIPRYKGDIENPRGGVRGVIPDKRIY